MVTFQVLQADGGVASAAINAATLALIDAGVPMKDYVCACSAAMVDDFPFLDLSHLEEVVVGSMVTFACLPRSKQIVLSEMSGRLHLDYLDKVMDAALKGCEDVFHIMDSIVRSQVAHMAAAMG
ncbi:unnamed protein product [Darwinula stevensoni]|uniref:Exosome component 4 n=1 Tax=Darwinula stevensoni TaxID=69355 RepID=A0A7R9AI43_9CRUS|nr:unnamed protein product [Darwinula stevensoni]CAG0905111.1 unnamed protein product [Darwinula stevensoni]